MGWGLRFWGVPGDSPWVSPREVGCGIVCELDEDGLDWPYFPFLLPGGDPDTVVTRW